jgi:hypothetical protein
MKAISRVKFGWLLAASLLVTLVLNIPYLVGWWLSSPGNQFGGEIISLEDQHSYVSALRQGAAGSWQYQLFYTHLPHEGGYVKLPYLTLGHVVGWMRGGQASTSDFIMALNIFRVLAGIGMMLTSYWLIAVYIDRPALRWLAWGVAILGGGLGWMLLPFLKESPFGLGLPVELNIPEGFSALILMSVPHLALARCMSYGGWILHLRAVEKANWKHSLMAGVAWLVMGLCVPFFIAQLGVLICVWLGVLWLARRAFPLREFLLSGVAGVLPVLYLIYNMVAFTSNPVYALWGQQNALPSPPVIDLVLAYGVLILCGLAALRDILARSDSPHMALLLAWPVTAFGLVYLPISIQRRLLEGVIVPLAIMAVWSVARLSQRVRPLVSLSIGAVVLALLIPSTVLLVAGGSITVARQAWPIFHPADERAGFDWLEREAQAGSVVFSTRASGTFLPAYAGMRVYVGHGPESLNTADKEQIAIKFYSDGMDDVDRLALLREIKARYVWVGIGEHPLLCHKDHCFDPDRLGLTPVFEQGTIAIYEVKP